jgi:hypothetical protein
MKDQRRSLLHAPRVPEVDSETGEYLFRFPIEGDGPDNAEDLFRWVLEENLRAMLDLVQLSDDEKPLRVTGYRFLSDEGFRPLYEGREDTDEPTTA